MVKGDTSILLQHMRDFPLISFFDVTLFLMFSGGTEKNKDMK